MCDIKPILSRLIDNTCVTHHMVGSPGYGVIKFEIPACDITLLRRRVHVPVGKKIDRFGLKLKHGCTWTEWAISHPECVAYVHRLDSFGVHYGKHVREYYVDQGAYGEGVIPEHVEWLGDAQVLQDALTYQDLIKGEF